jgi:hypothetical protein
MGEEKGTTDKAFKALLYSMTINRDQEIEFASYSGHLHGYASFGVRATSPLPVGHHRGIVSGADRTGGGCVLRTASFGSQQGSL